MKPVYAIFLPLLLSGCTAVSLNQQEPFDFPKPTPMQMKRQKLAPGASEQDVVRAMGRQPDKIEAARCGVNAQTPCRIYEYRDSKNVMWAYFVQPAATRGWRLEGTVLDAYWRPQPQNW